MKKTIIFDGESPKWNKNELTNVWVLNNYEHWLNDMLQMNGQLLLRDVYEHLGILITRESLVAGWTISSVPHFKFEYHFKPNGVIEIVLPEMESDIRYSFPSEQES